MSQIIVKGKASSKEWRLEIEEDDLKKTLLAFLQEHHFPIASSCSSKGQCLKCVTSQKELSCLKKMSDLAGETVSFDYL